MSTLTSPQGLCGALSELLEHLLGQPQNGNGHAPAEPREEKRLRPGMHKRLKFVRFLMEDGSLTRPRRVKNRRPEELKPPGGAVAAQFYNEWVALLDDHGHQVEMRSTEPVRFSPMYFFRAVAGTVEKLVEQGWIKPEYATAVGLQSRGHTIVMATAHDCLCGQHRFPFIITARSGYRILNPLTERG